MGQYILRLDDACEKRDVEKWDKIERLCDLYGIKPLVGIIPKCEDINMQYYKEDSMFWERVELWIKKGWNVAMHGYNHVYKSNCSGINPVNRESEFAGESLLEQRRKIREGLKIFREHRIDPTIFFAPSHTFDQNTIEALKMESNIISISDTPANKPYVKDEMIFVPQQTGMVRRLPFKIVTFCYHPNQMGEQDFYRLECFLKKHKNKFVSYENVLKKQRFKKKGIEDILISKMYFFARKMREKIKNK